MRSSRLGFMGVSVALLLGCLFAGPSAQAASDAAVVTKLDGKAQVFRKGSKAGTAVKKNDRITQDQQVHVGEKSRLELRFPDGTIMRFAERSVISMENLSYDAKTRNKNVKVDMEGGKLWANVAKLITPESKVEVKTVNAVAGVRGTVYRVNVDEDNSALVKVYDGSVYVDGVQKQAPGAAAPGGYTAPVPVPGPHEVPPPHREVTMEEWHVIVKSFQQITISPQGVASKPQDFNPQQDRDDWVRWNQERDKELQH